MKPWLLARLKAIAAPTPAALVAVLKLVGVDISADQAVAILAVVTPILVHWVPNIAPKPPAPPAPPAAAAT